jgi:hypothetical protein
MLKNIVLFSFDLIMCEIRGMSPFDSSKLRVIRRTKSHVISQNASAQFRMDFPQPCDSFALMRVELVENDSF